jgi:ABC-type nitrate/sulfonate/bicarbonate transport system ATPase subunit
LQTVELIDKIDAYPNHLSGGQAQRVSLARALIKKADVLLMDEPFSSLDIKTKTLLIKRFNDIFTNNPRTVVFVTHDVDEALALADTIIVLKDKNADFILNLSQDKSTRVYGEDVEKRKIIFDYLKK